MVVRVSKISYELIKNMNSSLLWYHIRKYRTEVQEIQYFMLMTNESEIHLKMLK